MTEQNRKGAWSRRAFLLGGAGAATVVAAHATGGHRPPAAAPVTALDDAQLAAAGVPDVHLAATDGWVSMPHRASQPTLAPFWPDPMAPGYDTATGQNLYVFGFRNVTNLTDAQVTAQRGAAQISAPQLSFEEGKDYRVKLTNLGLKVRPDLVDGHTIHWHGFVNAIPLFDGVPELSISVPIGRSFTYFYRPHDAGTYMYHCHFEDVEHVQMGMTGLLFVTPKQNGTAKTITLPGETTPRTFTRFAYNDGDGSTGYDREFGLFQTEIFAEGHYRDAHIQTTDWTDFKASFWCLNGRSYPDTVAPAAPLDPGSATAVSLQVSAASASTTTRVVTLTPVGGTAGIVAGTTKVTVTGFATTGGQAAPAYNVTNATVTAVTATTISYPAGTGTIRASVTGTGLTNARIAFTLPADPARTRGFDPLLAPDDALKWQPLSALVTCNAGERVLLRMANLGYQNHALTVDNIPLTVVAKDALLLRNAAGDTHYVTTSSVEVGPGESRDVLFTAPEHVGPGAYDTYLLYDRNFAYADNAGDPGSPGGMTTQIRVYPAATLPQQTVPNT